MTQFIPGLKLSEYFFDEAIQPIMADSFPQLPYSAARLDYGSDVLGFDTPMSMDHGWGPRMTLFLSPSDHTSYAEAIKAHFAHHLPFEIHGFPTHFGEPLEDGGKMAKKESYPINHMVTITTPEDFFDAYLGVDIRHSVTPSAWLTIPQQRLRTMKSGKIYYDGLGSLTQLRQQFDWYPYDLWLYLMANQWRRIDQEEPFVGRTGSVEDDLGSRLIAARLIRDMMGLCFLLEKAFAPYSKWFGSAFNQLQIAPRLVPIFKDILDSQNWVDRQNHLADAYLILGEAHNTLSLTPHIKPEVTNFYNRPFLVPHASTYTESLLEQIEDPDVKLLPQMLGSVDQISDNIDLLENIQRCHSLRVLFE